MKKRVNNEDKNLLRHHLIVWVLLIATILAGAVFLSSYIGNSKESKKRYETLMAVDSAGGDVEKALLDLRSYMYAHMNTAIGSPTGVKPPIQLKGTYDRKVAEEQARVKAANDELYNKAQRECEKLFPEGLSGKGRVPCITEYVTKNAVKERTIPEAEYKYDFVVPLWSPDMAGYSLVTSALLMLSLILSFISLKRTKNLLAN